MDRFLARGEKLMADKLSARLAAATYEPGQTYELASMADVFTLYCWLPDDRASLFLDELSSGLRLGAASFKLMSTIVGFLGVTSAIEAQPFRWVDDNKGEGTVRFQTEDGEELVSLNYERDPSPEPRSDKEGDTPQ